MSYIKAGYKVFRVSLSSLKESTLTDDVMKSYLEKNKKVNNILIFKSVSLETWLMTTL